ncbi:uncharacterized protein LOC142644540 [Castanea sativa]|uniref:uncharacterized protein LOC142644540 n=1 Tax=Castanea sativa TaxID=21020 RepID=UPI003F65307F
MNEFFTLHVHHGGHFDENPLKYVGGEVGVVDNCDPDKWSKVEIEAICRDFGYTHVSRLWYTRPGDNGVFELIKNDNDAMLMTELVRGHGEIHVYVEHPVHDPILINGGNGLPLDVVVQADYNDPLFVSDSENFSSSEPDHPFDGYYDGSNSENDDDWDDGGSASGRDGGSADGRAGCSADGRDGGSDGEVETLGCKRPGKEPIVEEPQQDGAVTTDSNDSLGRLM